MPQNRQALLSSTVAAANPFRKDLLFFRQPASNSSTHEPFQSWPSVKLGRPASKVKSQSTNESRGVLSFRKKYCRLVVKAKLQRFGVVPHRYQGESRRILEPPLKRLPRMTPRQAAKRAFRLQTVVIPATRLAGFTLVCALMALHNAAIFGNPLWPHVESFAIVASLYCLGSWLVLKGLFLRCRPFPLGDAFLIADILLILLAVDLSGGSQSWLFVLLAGRCVDQLAEGFRRTIWFNHLLVGSYALYLLLAATRQGEAPWTLCAAKLLLLYALNWYCSLSARTVDSIRARARKAELAKRREAEIVGTAAHAIRTSAEGISILTELIGRTSQDARARHYMKGLEQYTRDIMDKVRLLSAAAVEPRLPAVQEEPFAPRPLVEEVASLLRPFAESKGLDFRVEIGTEVPFSMIGDAAKIRQVLLSLTHNAIHFTDVGCVELRCLASTPGFAAFHVRDTGPGISVGVLRRISPSFFRADGTTWHRHHGARVGLSISHRLVELMGGSMIFHSEPCQGTTVCVELPMRGTTSVLVASQPSPAGDSASSLEVLLDRDVEIEIRRR